MALRVTQQSVDVLSEATGGKLRVTQFYVEVLGESGAAPNVTQTLGITDAATASVESTEHQVSASSALALVDTATELLEHNLSASSALAFTDEAVTAIRVSASSLLEFTDEATTNIFQEVASSVLAFTDMVNQEYDLLASSVLAFTQEAISSIKPLSASSVLALTDEALSSIKYLSASSVLALTDVGRSSIQYLSASSVLTLTVTAANNIKPVSASSVLVLAHANTKTLIHHLANVLFLDDLAEREAVFRRSAASALAMVQTVELFIDREGVLCNYSPSVGSGPFTFTTTPPTLTPSTLTLFWPFISPSLTVVLRNPEFGNKIGFNANRVNRKSRGGKKHIYRKATWPRFRTLSMDLSALTTTQIDDFKDFINQTLGLEIGILDHEGRTWKGIITTPDTEITAIGGGSCGDYATSFQFEGELA